MEEEGDMNDFLLQGSKNLVRLDARKVCVLQATDGSKGRRRRRRGWINGRSGSGILTQPEPYVRREESRGDHIVQSSSFLMLPSSVVGLRRASVVAASCLLLFWSREEG